MSGSTAGPGHPQSAWVHSWPRTLGLRFCEVYAVLEFIFVLSANGRMQPVVMVPKNLSTKHYRLNREKGTREN